MRHVRLRVVAGRSVESLSRRGNLHARSALEAKQPLHLMPHGDAQIDAEREQSQHDQPGSGRSPRAARACAAAGPHASPCWRRYSRRTTPRVVDGHIRRGRLPCGLRHPLKRVADRQAWPSSWPRDHAAPECTLALVKAASLACERARPLAACSRPRKRATPPIRPLEGRRLFTCRHTPDWGAMSIDRGRTKRAAEGATALEALTGALRQMAEVASPDDALEAIAEATAGATAAEAVVVRVLAEGRPLARSSRGSGRRRPPSPPNCRGSRLRRSEDGDAVALQRAPAWIRRRARAADRARGPRARPVGALPACAVLHDRTRDPRAAGCRACRDRAGGLGGNGKGVSPLPARELLRLGGDALATGLDVQRTADEIARAGGPGKRCRGRSRLAARRRPAAVCRRYFRHGRPGRARGSWTRSPRGALRRHLEFLGSVARPAPAGRPSAPVRTAARPLRRRCSTR